MGDAVEWMDGLLAKATPGEWLAIGGTLCAKGDNAHIQPNFQDGEYIAAAHNLMPKILEALRWGQAVANHVCGGPGLEACIDRLRDSHDALRSPEDAEMTP